MVALFSAGFTLAGDEEKVTQWVLVPLSTTGLKLLRCFKFASFKRMMRIMRGCIVRRRLTGDSAWRLYGDRVTHARSLVFHQGHFIVVRKASRWKRVRMTFSID